MPLFIHTNQELCDDLVDNDIPKMSKRQIFKSF